MAPARRWLARSVATSLGAVTSLAMPAMLIALRLPPGSLLVRAIVSVLDPFMRFLSAGSAVVALSVAFNAVYYLGLLLLWQIALAKQWPVFGRIGLVSVGSVLIYVFLGASFAFCELLLTGVLRAT